MISGNASGARILWGLDFLVLGIDLMLIALLASDTGQWTLVATIFSLGVFYTGLGLCVLTGNPMYVGFGYGAGVTAASTLTAISNTAGWILFGLGALITATGYYNDTCRRGASMSFWESTTKLSWFYLAIVNGIFLSGWSFVQKNKLHVFLDCSLLLILTAFSFVFFLLVKKYDLAFLSFALLSITLQRLVKMKGYKIQKSDVAWLPVLVTCLFVCSYIIGLIMLHFHMPWFISYLLPVLFYLLSLLVYKIQRKAWSNY